MKRDKPLSESHGIAWVKVGLTAWRLVRCKSTEKGLNSSLVMLWLSAIKTKLGLLPPENRQKSVLSSMN